MNELQSVWDVARGTRVKTESENDEICSLWLDGITILGANLASIHDWSENAERDHAMLGFLNPFRAETWRPDHEAG